MIDLDLLLMNGPTLTQRFGRQLDAVMTARNLTNAQLAARASITTKMVHSYRAGNNTPGSKIMLQLCLALDLSPADMFGWDDLSRIYRRSADFAGKDEMELHR